MHFDLKGIKPNCTDILLWKNKSAHYLTCRKKDMEKLFIYLLNKEGWTEGEVE
jgi:hypothetical protein